MPPGNRRVRIVLRYGGTRTAAYGPDRNTAPELSDQTVLVVWGAPMRRSVGQQVTYNGSPNLEVAPSRARYRTRSISGVDPQTLADGSGRAEIGGRSWPIKAAYHDHHHRNLIIEL